MNDSKKLVKNTTIYALGDIIPRLLGFISFPILTRYLSPADYGIVNYVNTLTTFLLTFGFLCMNTYYLVYFYRCDNEVEQKKLLGNLSSFVIGLNLALVFLLLLFGKYIFALLNSNIDFYPYIVIAILTNFFNIFSVLPSALYRLLEKPLLLTIINVSRGIVTLVITLVLVMYFDYTALGVLYAALIVNVVYAFVFLYTTRNYIIWNFNFPQIKKILIFSLPLVPGTLAYYVTTISDRILIDKYLNLNDLGIYSTAATLALILNIFSYGAYKAFEPFIFKNWGNEGFLKTFENIRNGFVYILLIGVLCLSIFSKEFYLIMTNVKFHSAYWFVPMIIIGVYSSSLSMLYGTIITAKEKTKVNSLISIIGAAISIVLNVLFLPRFGLITAALVSSLAMTIMLLLSIWYSQLKISHLRPLLGTIIVGISIYLFVYVININHIVISILIKSVVAISIIVILSIILSVNPFKMIKELNKK
ncbi:lipopolysaccharide biosynthesis protein [Flavobacterium sp. '19STA2R22 D10 B1']|uniref:lipopolysaccharide biosynthesis protein n=1 Tax=Flavobacterium aerium TaxID=3037261 RepID=UPI00278BEFAE|nr:oligosaccharide flippase family protein [Flavobacterium sp. '19STA2R22 D10 B1']